MVSELCRHYGISRTTGYKWLDRWLDNGPEGCRTAVRARARLRGLTAPEVVEAIIEVRRKYTDYDAKKMTWYLLRNRPELQLPSRTAIHNILHRHIRS